VTLVGILECGQTRGDWLEEYGEMAAPFPPFLHRVDPFVAFAIYRAHKNEIPERPEACDAWLVTGSPLSVYEHPAWQSRLASFLVNAARHRPVVGICYGHQLLHEAFGGKVEKASEGWGIGVQRYELHEVPRWAPEQELREALRLIAFHQDQVTTPAPGSRVLAGNSFCPLGITTIGDNVLTIQAHPEMSRKLARDLYEEQRTRNGDDLTDRAVASLGGEIDVDLAARWILAFIEHRQAQRRGAL